ncbi:MAG: DODA-type extradiol aromatic ring-opening family dioxygenase [Burkholderiales bacterium]
MQSLPSLFLSHGAPTTAIDPGTTGAMFTRLGQRLPRPHAIVMVSAHHLTAVPEVGTALRPDTVYDFSGFPPALYQIKYPAVGAADVGERVAGLLREADIDVQINPQRGLDHGAWVPLVHMYPNADIPIVPLSIQPRMDARHHFAVGRAIASLRDAGVLVVGSGNLTHNLRDIQRWERDAGTTPYVTAFQAWFAERLAARDIDALLDWNQQAPHAARAHPTDDHLLPIFVALGAAGTATATRRLHADVTYGVLAMDAYAFGDAGAEFDAFGNLAADREGS